MLRQPLFSCSGCLRIQFFNLDTHVSDLREAMPRQRSLIRTSDLQDAMTRQRSLYTYSTP